MLLQNIHGVVCYVIPSALNYIIFILQHALYNSPYASELLLLVLVIYMKIENLHV